VSRDTLTAREEAFCRAIADGLGPSEAYRQSHGSKMAPDAVASNAKRLLRRSRVKERIAELKVEASGGSDLTPKQERFCWLYIEKSNASEAYRLAYDVGPDTKPESIHRSAAELLANPKVTSRIEAIRAELRDRSAITLDHLVEALRPLAFSDIRRVMTWGDAVPVTDPETGQVSIAQGIAIKSITEIDDFAAAMILEISETKDGAKRIKLHDKLAAIEKLAKLMGLIKEQHEHSGTIKVEDPRPKAPSPERLAEILARYGVGGNEGQGERDAEQSRRERFDMTRRRD
jgi:phage terminase small subunit